MTEPDLVNQAKLGDEAATTELLSVHSQQAYRLALHILRNRADAEDATQNAFVKAFAELSRFQRQSSFATWVRLRAILTGEIKGSVGLRQLQESPKTSHLDIPWG